MRHRRASTARGCRQWLAAAAVGLGLLIPGLAPADEPPRYALRRVYGEEPGPRVLVIALPWVSRDRYGASMPHLENLMQRGAVGLMPAAAFSDPDPGRTWVTLGAGRAAVGGLEEAAWTQEEGGGAKVSVSDLYAANRSARTSARPGLLGSRLRASGLRTGVVVYGEVDEDHAPLGLAALMDEEGQVDRFYLAPACIPGKVAQAGAEAVREALSKCDIVLIQIQALAAPVEHGSPGDYRAHANTWHVGLADEMIGECLELIEGMEALVLVVSPVSPDPGDREERRLTPVVMYQSGEESGPGLLTSASTRWEGLVAAADFAPTVLSWWGLEEGAAHPGMSGRAMRSVPSEGAIARVTSLDEALTYRHQLQLAAAKCYGGYGAVLVAVALAIILAARRRLSVLRGPGLALALAPIGLLLSPLCGLRTIWAELLAAAAIAAALTLGGLRIGPPRRAIAVALLAGAALILGDALSGSHLMRRSALGFGVMAGSRFYGLGNEYLGVLLGMSAVGLGALADLSASGRKLAGAMGVLVVLAIGAPFGGANWGGSFAAAAGLLGLWVIATEGRRVRLAPAVIVLLAASAIAPAAMDLLTAAEQRSHIGLTSAALAAGQAGTLGDTICRKLAMNKAVLLYSPLNGLIALAAAALLWLLLRRGGAIREALSGGRGLRAGLIGALIGAVTASLVNDSGLVAAGGAVAVAIGASLFLSARAGEVAR